LNLGKSKYYATLASTTTQLLVTVFFQNTILSIEKLIETWAIVGGRASCIIYIFMYASRNCSMDDRDTGFTILE